MIKEKEIQKSIVEWLQWKKIFHWRNNSGAMFSEYKGKKRFMRFGEVGSPDLFAVRPLEVEALNFNMPIESPTFGQIYGIECKAPKGKQSEVQKEWQKNFEEAGGVYILAKSINDVEKILK